MSGVLAVLMLVGAWGILWWGFGHIKSKTAYGGPDLGPIAPRPPPLEAARTAQKGVKQPDGRR